jgi:hypothetical protein
MSILLFCCCMFSFEHRNVWTYEELLRLNPGIGAFHITHLASLILITSFRFCTNILTNAVYHHTSSPEFSNMETGKQVPGLGSATCPVAPLVDPGASPDFICTAQ